ncbi:MAG: hypothetical protein ACTHJT_11925 [Cytophaga sp.]|uniref:hypothetical protein n=1 Tax=Cytophaga sp. TaxID=29535 RepID=UPI003F7E1B6B
MKKVIIAVSLLAAALVSNAQDVSVTTVTPDPAAKQYKPVQGDVLAELGLFGGDFVNLPTSTFGTPQLKFRYFLQDQIALRAGVNLSQHVETTKIDGGAAGTGSQKNMTSIWGINAGLEKHFTGTGRLSTYVGADLSLQLMGASGKRENTADGSTFTDGESETRKGYNFNGDNSSFGFGLRAVTGADYYFVDKVYLGAEFGWGFMAMRDGKTKTEVTTGGVTQPEVTTKSTGGTFDLMPSLTAGVRIGYRF